MKIVKLAWGHVDLESISFISHQDEFGGLFVHLKLHDKPIYVNRKSLEGRYVSVEQLKQDHEETIKQWMIL